MAAKPFTEEDWFKALPDLKKGMYEALVAEQGRIMRSKPLMRLAQVGELMQALAKEGAEKTLHSPRRF